MDGTFTGHVGTAGSSRRIRNRAQRTSDSCPGTYEFDITDYAAIHNFDLCKGASCTGPNSVDKTDIGGTGIGQWTVDLTPGTYTYQCDVHSTRCRAVHGQR